MQVQRAAQLSGAVVEVAFEGGAVELGEVGHEGEGAVALKPAELGVQRAIVAAESSGQSAPVRPAKFQGLFRGNLLAGKTDREHFAYQLDLLLRQSGNDLQRIGVVVAMIGRCLDLSQLLLVRQRVVARKEPRETSGQPDTDRETQSDNDSCQKAGMRDSHVN